MKHVAVVIPGVMGCELKTKEGQLIWPGPVLSLAFHYNLMDQLMQEDLSVGGLIRSYATITQYGELIADLRICGFRESDAPPTLVAFAYDWRKSNKLAAEDLANKIDEIVNLHNGDADISLIGHSMGGLVARYYLESGNFETRPGLKKVVRLITLATPHRGAPLALTAAIGEEKRLFLSKAQVKLIANDDRYPAVYELLPPVGEPFAWNIKSELKEISIYDPAVAKSLGLNLANLKAAEEFRKGIDSNKRPAGVRYFFFAGTRIVTLAQLRFRDSPKERALSPEHDVIKDETEDSGDGTVPAWSGSMTGFQAQMVGGEHSVIYKDSGLKRTLGALLGKPGLLAPISPQVELTVRDRVIDPARPVHVTLLFPSRVSQLKGELRFEEMQMDAAGKPEGFALYDKPYPVSYAGVEAETMAFALKGPNIRGIYRVAFYQDADPAPSAKDEFIVQS
jgi:phospholipase A1